MAGERGWVGEGKTKFVGATALCLEEECCKREIGVEQRDWKDETESQTAAAAQHSPP